MPPSNEFSLLEALLLHLEGRVEARVGIEEPDPAWRTRLEKFAEGRLAPDELAKLCDELRDRPDLVAWLADSIKQRQNPDPAADG